MKTGDRLNKLILKAIIGTVSCLFIGCATLSKEECLKGEWRAIGYQDGVKGYDMQRLEKHEKACSDYGVKPEIARYQEGRKVGLAYYCTSSQKAAKSSEEERKNDQGDWLAIGFYNGKQGEPLSKLKYYVENCSQHDIQVDMDIYQTGWHDGITQYCTSENGYKVGSAGKNYDNACPEHLAGAFLDQYIAGLSSRLSSIENNMDFKLSSANRLANQLEMTDDKEARKSLRNQLQSERTGYSRAMQEHRDITNLYNKAQRLRIRVK
jgi:hypothetical protein